MSGEAAADPGWASALWDSDPVQVFERLRDDVSSAMQAAMAIHDAARVCPFGHLLSRVRADLRGNLHRAVVEAQDVWVLTPARRYIDRPGGPVYLDGGRLADGTVGRVCGSSYHDLALAVSSTLVRSIEGRQPGCIWAGHWTENMEFLTAAGSNVSQCFADLIARVGCECQAAIARWGQEQESHVGAMGSGKNKKPKKSNRPRGNPGLSEKERKKRVKLFEDWEASGQTKREFLRDLGFPPDGDAETSLVYFDACRKLARPSGRPAGDK